MLSWCFFNAGFPMVANHHYGIEPIPSRTPSAISLPGRQYIYQYDLSLQQMSISNMMALLHG
jgi:hypothetical protein